MRRTLFVGLTWLLLCASASAQTLGTITGEVKRFHRRRHSRGHGHGGEQGDQCHPHDIRPTRSACSTFRRCRRAPTP